MTVTVYVVGTGAGAELHDVDNFRDLHVRLAACSSIGGFGELDGDHAWLDPEALRAAGPDTPAWRDGFEAMLGFAAKHGWTSDDGRRVRAHVVRS